MNRQPFISGLARAAIIFSLPLLAWAGNITTDGTTGAAQSLTGPRYAIPQSLGTTVGNNLFHSFGQFNLTQGDIATFTGANTLQNVISRVTGGSASSIDGTIKSEIGNANFFFINPAGIIFGEHAAVDVPAAFHVSTAQELRFADGVRFSAVMPAGSSFTSAAPEAFGFLALSGAIQMNKSNLTFKDGSAVTVAGGSIAMTGKDRSITSTNPVENWLYHNIEAPQGDLRIYAQGNSIELVPINGYLPTGNGTIILNDVACMMSGNGGGSFRISGGDLVITNNSDLSIINTGEPLEPLLGVTKDATGEININARSLLLENSSIRGESNSSGKAGNVNITVNGDIKLLKSAMVSSSSWNQGNAGDVTVNASNLTIDDGSSIESMSKNALLGTTSGNAGNVNVTVSGEMQILNGGNVSASSMNEGIAGNIAVNAGHLIIDSKGFSDSSIEYLYKGNLWDGTMEVDFNKTWETPQYTGILSNAGFFTSSKGGNITVNVNDKLDILNGGQISTSSSSVLGDAGTINITTKYLQINSKNFTEWDTGILSLMDLTKWKNGGKYGWNIGYQGSSYGRKSGSINIDILRDTQLLGNLENLNSVISSKNNETYGGNDAGKISISGAGRISLTGSSINTSAQNGKGGPININASLLDLTNSQITTSVEAGGNGGDISIHGNYLVMDTGFIQANTAAKGATGGNIFIDELGVIGKGGVVSVGGLERETFHTNFGKNIIQAAAPDGVSGNVKLTSPDTIPIICRKLLYT
ncbi:putative Haemagg_act domain-containing protein [Gammaproteobacteria bacterium]